MSHHEENYDERMFKMESHLYRVLYTPAFKDAWLNFFESSPVFTEMRLWYGPIQSYWLKPGQTKKFITLVLEYRGKQVVYEQDSLDTPEGVFHIRK